MSNAQRTRIVVPAEQAGLRLDQLLAAHVVGLSRRKARTLIDIGGVFVAGARVKVAGRKVRAGQIVVAHLGQALEQETSGQATDAGEVLAEIDILFEDEDIVVVDKPAGLLTAPTPESDRNNLRWALEQGGRKIWIVHRLDRPTSGVVILAKTSDANRTLSETFRTHDLVREYIAIVAGKWPADQRVLDSPVGGKSAKTLVEVEATFARATQLRCRLETGRTHQIRLHCSSIGHPVLGDRRYGRRIELEPPRLALHAAKLELNHPRTLERLAFERPLPPDLSTWVERLQG